MRSDQPQAEADYDADETASCPVGPTYTSHLPILGLANFHKPKVEIKEEPESQSATGDDKKRMKMKPADSIRALELPEVKDPKPHINRKAPQQGSPQASSFASPPALGIAPRAPPRPEVAPKVRGSIGIQFSQAHNPRLHPRQEQSLRDKPHGAGAVYPRESDPQVCPGTFPKFAPAPRSGLPGEVVAGARPFAMEKRNKRIIDERVDRFTDRMLGENSSSSSAATSAATGSTSAATGAATPRQRDVRLESIVAGSVRLIPRGVSPPPGFPWNDADRSRDGHGDGDASAATGAASWHSDGDAGPWRDAWRSTEPPEQLDPTFDAEGGLHPVQGPQLFENKARQLVNRHGQRVDRDGRITRARGAQGAGSRMRHNNRPHR